MSKQRERVLNHLKTGQPLNRLGAWTLIGVIEAPARICELRKAGWPIVTEMVKVRNRYGEIVKVAQWTLPPNSTQGCSAAA